MRNTLLVSALMFASCVNSICAQTVSDIERAYGQPLDVYSVSEHIWMTPEYAADGNICLMRLYPKRIDQKADYVCSSCGLDSKELKAFLNQLIPPSARGLQNDSFGQTATGGPAAWTTYRYERVTFTFVSPFGPFPYDPTIIRKGEFVFSASLGPSEKPKSRLPTDEDFSASLSAANQIVTIRWNDRNCAER